MSERRRDLPADLEETLEKYVKGRPDHVRGREG
jgi:hypothetical protein